MVSFQHILVQRYNISLIALEHSRTGVLKVRIVDETPARVLLCVKLNLSALSRLNHRVVSRFV